MTSHLLCVGKCEKEVDPVYNTLTSADPILSPISPLWTDQVQNIVFIFIYEATNCWLTEESIEKTKSAADQENKQPSSVYLV